MVVKTVEQTVPELRIPDVWPAWAPLVDRLSPADQVQPREREGAGGPVNFSLLLGLQDNFCASRIAQAPLPVPDSADLSIDALDVVEDELPGAVGLTLGGMDEAITIADDIQRELQSDPDLRDLQPQVAEVVYLATNLRQSVKRTSTAAGEARILSASVTRCHTTTIRRNPTQGRMRVVAQGLASRRSQSAAAVSTRKLAQSQRIAEKVQEASLNSNRAVEQSSGLGGVLRYLGSFAKNGRKRWNITALAQRVPGETQDLLNRLSATLRS